MEIWKQLAAVAASLVALGAHASTAAGLWYNGSESGWGLNLSQQGNTVFATMFVYGANNKPIWYVTPNLAQISATTFSGEMYETSGPWFGGAFNPASVAARVVGNMTFRSDFGTSGTVSYTVDGISVVKSIVRQTWRTISLGGDFRVAFVNLPLASNECTTIGLTNFDDIRVRDNGSITIFGSTGAAVCEISGQFTQYGEYLGFVGGIACGSSQSNFSGTAVITDIRGEGIVGETTGTEFLSGILFVTGSGNCSKRYHFGGARYNPS